MDLDLEFSQAFMETRLTRQEAADFLGLDVSNVRRMLNGNTKPKRAYIEALRMLAGFAPVMSRRDKDFRNWRFSQGKLWTDEGMGFTAAEIRSIWHVDQLLRAQEKKIRDLNAALAALQAELEALQPEEEMLPDNVILFPGVETGGNAA